MFFEETWLDMATRGLVLAFLAICWIVLLIRLNGLRSLSKMTNFDFVMTIALGSLVANASQATDWQQFGQALAGTAGLFLVQFVAARLRKTSETFEGVVRNEPIILMRNGQFCETAMADTRVPRDDLVAKLRAANVLDLSSVRAVVLETTGDVSVLHGDSLSEAVLEGVRQP